MRFTDPWFAVLFLPVAAGLWFSWKHMHGMASWRKRAAFGVRGMLAAVLILALMGPQSYRPNKGTATIFVIDKSDSIQDSEQERAEALVREAIAEMGEQDSAGVVVFGKDPKLESLPAPRRTLPPIQSEVDASASDLAAALRLANASFPEGKGRRIVVLSDGNETRGDAAGFADAAAVDGIEVDFLPLLAKKQEVEAAILEVQSPTEVRADQPFEVRVLVESSVAQEAVISLDRDGVSQQQVRVQLSPGKNQILIPQTLDESGFFRYRATLDAPRDGDTRNNVGSGFVAIRGKPRVLVLQGDTSQSELTDALGNQGIEADLFGAQGVPNRPETLLNYDAILLNDLNARFLAPSQMQLLATVAEGSGVGLGMVGGEDSFLPGGWYGTPVEDALPVDLDVRQRKTFPSTSVAIVVDASGSMGMVEGGIPKIQLAAQAAAETVRLLNAADRVGVAGSTDRIEFVAPIQSLENKASVISQIKKLRPGGGGIYVESSVKFARTALEQQNTKVRHLILLADGADADEHGQSLAIASAMRANKITTSVVAIGKGKDERFLQTLAAAGGGQYYLAEEASRLPAIFTQDVALMSRSAIEEGAFLPRLAAGMDAVRGIDPNSVPPLYAYCLTSLKPLARVGMLTHKDDPLYAEWQYGLATTMAFTSDAKSQWASEWIAWDGFARFWAQAVRSVSRRAAQGRYALDVEQDGGRGKITLEATDALGGALAGDDAEVLVSSPDGQVRDVRLTQTAPGVYEGHFEASDLGSYVVSIAEQAGGQTRVQSSGFSVSYPAEYRAFQTDTAMLNRLSETTGGREIGTADEALRPVPNPGESIADLWRFFLLAAALILPFDIAIRRVAIPFAEIWASLLARFRRAPREKPATEHLERLKRAKRTSEPTATPVTIKTEPQSRAEPQSAPPKQHEPGGSLGSRLMDRKRKRDRD